MASRKFAYKGCPNCQDKAYFYKVISTGIILLRCEDCYSSWSSPDAFDRGDYLHDDSGESQVATLKEIAKAGWGDKIAGSGR